VPTEVDLTWFRPLPKQRAFIASTADECVYAGGVGSGKTLSGCIKTLLTAVNYPGTNILVGRQTYRALQDTTKRVLIDGDDKPPIIPPELIKHRSEQDQTITLLNGTTILFRSLEPHNIEKLLSLNLGAFYVDETTETARVIWETLIGRLRHPAGPRKGWGTTNPNGHDWTWSLFHPDGSEHDPARDLIIAPTQENIHLEPDVLARLYRQPKEWIKRFVLCSFESASGMIYDEFDRRIHVYEHFDLPYQWRRWEAMDWGMRNPACVLWFAMDNDGNVWIYDEHYADGLRPAEHATAIKSIRGGRQFPPIQADPSMWATGFTNRNVADEFQKQGIALAQASNDRGHGFAVVKSYLQRVDGDDFPHGHPLHGVETGAPRLFISDRCRNLVRELPEYVWKMLSPTREQTEDQPEEPRKKNDHACDTMRYGMARLRKPNQPRIIDNDRPRDRAYSAGIVGRTF
jgi:hypothetical protein